MKDSLSAFNTEVSDPSFAAMLATLGFPLARLPRQTVLADLNSVTEASGSTVAWKFGGESVTRRGLTFERVCALWGKPHVQPVAGEMPEDVILCKRALHNYRVLLTQVHRNGHLWAARYGVGYRLASWGRAEYEEVQPLADAPLAGVPRSDSAAAVAVAVTLGVPVIGFEASGARVVWYLGPCAEGCPWTGEMLLAIGADEAYIRAHEDPPAVLHALFANRRVLAGMPAVPQARTMVLSKRGRYAVFSSTASERRQEECLRHLNV